MTIRRVPGTYATVQDAVDASNPGDTILIAANFRGGEVVAVQTDNLIVDAPANVTGLYLDLFGYDLKVTLTGKASIGVDSIGGWNTVIGNDGDNLISDFGASWSDERFDGGGGADRLVSNEGFDRLNGDAGDDVLALYGDGGFVDGGTGIDTVRFGDLTGYTIRNVEVLDIGDRWRSNAEVGQLSSFKTIIDGDAEAADSRFVFNLTGKGGIIDFSTRVGGAHSVEVSGETLTSGLKLTGTANADDLFGSEYLDTLDGGGGADLIRDFWGGDVLKGGAGDDTIDLRGVFFLNYGVGSIDGGGGIDTVKAPYGALMDYNLTGVEILDADYVHGTAKQIASFATIIDSDRDTPGTGRFGAILDGPGGSIDFSTRLRDGRSLDLDASDASSGVTVTGTARNDLLEGSKSRDTLKGGAGSDVFVVQNATDLVVEAKNGGTDTIQATVTYKLAARQAVESLATADAAGKGAIALTGNELANAITGNAGANTLDGGLGKDLLKGLAGKDTFLFKTALGPSNVDRIADFVAKDDTVRLENGVFKALDTGTLSASAFKDITSASTKLDADDRVLYNHDTGALYYDADGSGAKARVQFAILDTDPILKAADFFVV